MTGRRLILNDGTIIENGEAGYSTGSICLWVTGMTMQEAAMLFFDPSKTAVITFQYGQMEDVYEGYTRCVLLLIDEDGEITITMKREVSA